MLMCRRHWFMVPRGIQRSVWATYREGQCDDKRPSKEWHEAADAAIGYVAIRERKIVTARQVVALRAHGFETSVDDAGELVTKEVA